MARPTVGICPSAGEAGGVRVGSGNAVDEGSAAPPCWPASGVAVSLGAGDAVTVGVSVGEANVGGAGGSSVACNGCGVAGRGVAVNVGLGVRVGVAPAATADEPAWQPASANSIARATANHTPR
jgi:hypothetical protein